MTNNYKNNCIINIAIVVLIRRKKN